MKLIKIAQNSISSVFRWVAPTAISGTPTVIFRMTAGDEAPVLAPLHAPAIVTAIGDNRRYLTINPPIVNFLGASGRWGQAWLETASDSAYPVRVVRVTGATAHLADPLPRGIDLSASALLEWATWTCTPGAAITATLGSFIWDVTYVSNSGADVPSDTQTSSGLISIVRRPFSSGLNHEGLVAVVPALADMIPRRQQDFLPQISIAEDEVALKIRDVLAVDDYTEDDLFNGHIFARATAYYTAAIIYEGVGQLDTAVGYRARGDEFFHNAGRSLIIDLNRDGSMGQVLNLATTREAKTGGRVSDVRGSLKTRVASENEMTPSRGMRH